MAYIPVRLALLTSAFTCAFVAAAPQEARAQAGPPAQAASVRGASPAYALFEAGERGETPVLERALADPATGPDLRVLLRAALAASRFDPAAGRDPALRRLAAPGADPALRRVALRIVTATSFWEGDFAEAARTGQQLDEALRAIGLTEAAQGVERGWRLAALLAGHGRAQVVDAVRAGTIPARRDAVGLTRIAIGINGQSQDAVIDSGANFSVLSATTARRLGVAPLAGETPISNGVQTTLPTRVGIAARLEVAGTVLTDVPMLILDDASLTFAQVPGGYSIPAILGLPELRALKRVRIEQAGRFTVLPPAEGEAGPANLHASGNELYADMSVDGTVVPLHLDTGAGQSRLSALYAAANPARLAGLRSASIRTASAGGARSGSLALWPNAPVALAGRSFVVPTLPIELPAEEPLPRRNGVLGSDVLGRFQSYTLDFEHMRLSLGTPMETAVR